MPKSSPEKLAAALRANLKKRKSPQPGPAASDPGGVPPKPAEMPPENHGEPPESPEK